jgi:hypothetical protein
MKSYLKVLLISVLAFSATVKYAKADDSAEFLFIGQTSQELNLDSVKYRTEYENRPVQSTCYRQEPREVTRCRNFPDGHQECWREVVYVNIPYSCTVWERKYD